MGKYSVVTVFTAKDFLTRKIEKMTAAVRRFDQAASGSFLKVNKHVATLSNSATSLMRTVGKIGIPAAIGFGFGVKSAAGFEQAIVNASTKLGIFRSESDAMMGRFKNLQKEVLAVGKTTEFTSTSIADLARQMGQAGFKEAEVIGTLRNAVDVASAGQVDLNTAFDATKRVMGAFGMLMDDNIDKIKAYEKATNLLVYAANNSATDMIELGEAFKMSGTAVAAAGTSYTEHTAMLMALANAGLEGTIAGTGLQRVITNITQQTPEAVKLLRRLGVSTTELRDGILHTRPAFDVFADLGAAIAKVDPAHQLPILTTLFDRIGTKSAGPMIKALKAVRGYNDELQNLEGYLQRVANEQRGTLLTSLMKLWSAIDALIIKIGDLNNGPLKDVVDRMANWINKNEEFMASGIGEFIGVIIDNIGKLTIAFGALIATVGGLWAVKTAIGAIAGVMTVFGVTAGGALAILGAIPLAIAAIGVAIWAMWEPLTIFFENLPDYLSRFGNHILTYFTNPLQAAIDTWNWFVDSIGTAWDYYFGDGPGSYTGRLMEERGLNNDGVQTQAPQPVTVSPFAGTIDGAAQITVAAAEGSTAEMKTTKPMTGVRLQLANTGAM